MAKKGLAEPPAGAERELGIIAHGGGSYIQGQLGGPHHAATSEAEVRNLVCQNCWSQLFVSQKFQDVCDYDVPENYLDYAESPKTARYQVLGSRVRDCKRFCQWCALIHDHRPAGTIDDKDHTFVVHFGQDPERTGTPVGRNHWTATIQLQSGQQKPKPTWRRLCAYTSSDDKAAAHITARPFVVELDTTSAMDQIKLWLKACEHHAACPAQVRGQLPTRVIDVGATESELPKLYVTQRESGQYAALSYCWGGPQRAALLRDWLTQYRRCLPMDDISQSIKDAIKVVRAIGMRYLWVDALCIIQDSDADKNLEISGMDGVYRGALFTISAESAATAQEGFLAPRNRPKFYQVPFRCHDGSLGTMCLYTYDKEEGPAALDPLETRAWSFQESTLSTRRVIFNSKTLQWHCPGTQCHLGSSLCQDTKGYARAPVAADHFRQMLSSADRRWSPGEKETWSTGWQLMMHVYSGRKHTDPLDRLIALSGVVKALVSARDLAYVAGLWRDQLVDQLLWCVPGYGRLPRPLLAYRAPSWSWASIDDQIISGTYLTRAPACEIIECEAVPLSKDVPYGAVQDAWLVIAGSVQKGDYCNYSSFQEEAKISWHGEDFLWKGDDPEPGRYRISNTKSASTADLKWDISFDSQEHAPEGTAIFLIVAQAKAEFNSLSLTKQISGLILKARTDGAYQRIGYFESRYSENDYLDLRLLFIPPRSPT